MNSNKQKVIKVRERLYDWMIGDIKKAAHLKKDCSGYFDDNRRSEIKKIIPDYDGGSMIGGFILALQAIQVLSKLAFGEKDGLAFNDFVKEFMPEYKNINLYELRNSLFKQYTSKKTDRGIVIANFALWSRNPDNHKKVDNGLTNLNLENFVLDVEKGFNHFFDKGVNHREEKIIKYHDDYLMGSVSALSGVVPRFLEM